MKKLTYITNNYGKYIATKEKMKNFDKSIRITIENDRIALLQNGQKIKF